jgi:hypothetical protein
MKNNNSDSNQTRIISDNTQNNSDLEFMWVGIGSENFAEATDFIKDTLGIEPLYPISPDSHYALFRLPSCQDIEIISLKSRWGIYQQYPVVGFSVPNIEHYCQILKTAGVLFASEIVSAKGWGKFCYTELSEGFYCELIEKEPSDGGASFQVNPIYGIASLTLLVQDVQKMASRMAVILGVQQKPMNIECGDRATFSLANGIIVEILSCSQVNWKENGTPGAIIGFCVSESLSLACSLLEKRGINFIEQSPTILQQNRCYFMGLDGVLYSI